MTSTPPGEALHRLLHAYKHAMRHACRDAGIDLPVSHLRMLKVIGLHSHCTAHDIVRHQHRDKAQVTRVVKELTRAGLVVSRADPDDGRRRLLAPTTAGHAMLERIAGAEHAAAKRMLHGLPQPDVDRFVALAEAMTHNLRTSRT